MTNPIHTHTQQGFGFDIPIFAKLYELYKIFSQYLTSFPKTRRYTLGQKIDKTALDIFELLFSIPASENKYKILQVISNKLDLLKVLLRLAKDSNCLQDRQYLELQQALQEVGKMLGGWIKSTKQSPQNFS